MYPMTEYWDKRHGEQGLRAVGHASFSQIEFEERTERLLKYVKRYIKENKIFPEGGIILDYGCGYGRFSKLLTEMGFKVYGTDISQQALKQAMCHAPEANFIREEHFRRDAIKDFFDGVFCWTVLQHIPPEWIEDICQRLMAVMRSDGTLLAYENITPAESKSHIWFRSTKEYQAFFKGLTLESDKEMTWVDGPTGEAHSLMVFRK